MTRHWRSATAVLAAILPAVLLAGCGLPLAGGVHRAGEVPADQRLPQPISVLPPGPQPGAPPEGIVTGFLVAQGSARDDHGIARSFLAPPARAAWRAGAGVTVYDPRTVTTATPIPDGDGFVQVTLDLDVVGTVEADGAARVQPAQRRSLRYRLHRGDAGQWQLVAVPDGLTLSPAARDRSYDAMAVHFLAPGGAPGGRHLVADLVQLPADGDRAREVVDRLLAGPSSALAGSVETALPRGTRLHAPVTTTTGGEVTVDLTGPAAAMSGQTGADLSAQVVFTLREALPAFSRLRLLVDGELLVVPGATQPQPRTAWPSYAPDGPAKLPAGVALVGGQLRSLSPDGNERPTEPPADVAGVLDLAVDARQPRVAVLTGEDSTRTLRTGRFSGPLTPGLQDPGLRSPSWGSGELGLWLLRTGARPAVLLVPPTAGAIPVEVQVDALPALDGNALLRVSRDGTRVALVAGRVLFVGRLEFNGRRPHLVALRRLATGVLDVAWQTGTTLEALVEDTEPPLLPLLRLSVDGTSAQFSGLVGGEGGQPAAIAAFGDQPLLVETRTGTRSTIFSGDVGTAFEVRLRDAARPSYPR